MGGTVEWNRQILESFKKKSIGSIIYALVEREMEEQGNIIEESRMMYKFPTGE